MTCFMCQKPLSGGLDTYGDFGMEQCWDCFWRWQDEQKAQARHYAFLTKEANEAAEEYYQLYGSLYRTVKPVSSGKPFRPYAYLETH